MRERKVEIMYEYMWKVRGLNESEFETVTIKKLRKELNELDKELERESDPNADVDERDDYM